MRVLISVVPLVAVLVLVAALPTVALELQGEHRLLVSYTADWPEFRASEALVIQGQDRWLELVVTQTWSRVSPPKLGAEVSVWRTIGGWDYGLGLLWRAREGRLEPWAMLARPW